MLSCNSTISMLNLPFRQFLMFVCKFMRVSTYQIVFIVVPLRVHSTSTDSEISKDSINVAFLANILDLDFITRGKFLYLHINEDRFLIMALWFIACNYVVEKHVPSFRKRTRFFLQAAMHTARCLAVCMCDPAPKKVLSGLKIYFLFFAQNFQ